ncbi:MAG TPA: hypothetical protein VEW08_03595 [Steroidobacteraceae bacterium]|nr:hypothetical protein [Steroidobacteraceae bacterium]
MAAAMWVRLGISGTELGMANLANASISGAFLETTLQLPVNANVILEPVSTAGVALEGVKLSARVARVDRRGLGIEWRAMIAPQLLALLTGTPLPSEGATATSIGEITWP